MPSGSLTYFVFVAAIFFLYWAAPRMGALRLLILLAASYFFCSRYGWFYVALLPACATIEFAIGCALAASKSTTLRRILVLTRVELNINDLISSRHHSCEHHLAQRPSNLQSLSFTIALYSN